MGCPAMIDVLVAYGDDELSLSERAAIEAHVVKCAVCQKELATLSALQTRIGQSLQARATQVAPSPQAWSHLQATLTRETRPTLVWLPIPTPTWFRRLVSGVGRTNQIVEGGIAMKKGFAVTAIAALVMALSVSVMALVPSVRAEILRIVHGSAPAALVGRLSETPFSGGVPVTMTDVETGKSTTAYLGKMHETARQTVSWDEAQMAVGFPLRQPTYLPDGAELARVELVTVPDADGHPRDQRVELVYILGDSELMLEQSPAFPEVLGPPPGAETVTVNGAPGWTVVSDENSILSWQTSEARYFLNGYLPLEEMLKIAESIS